MTVKISGANCGQFPPPRAASAEPPPAVEHEPEPEPEHRSRPVSVSVSASDTPAVPMPAYVPSPVHPPQPSEYGMASAPWQPELEPAPGAEAAPDGSWYAAVESVQRHTAQAHAACQRMLTDSHIAFLRMTETTLAAMLGGSHPGGAAEFPVAGAPDVYAGGGLDVSVPTPPLPLPRSSSPRPAPAPAPVAPSAPPAPAMSAVPAAVPPPASAPAAVPVQAPGPGPDPDPDPADGAMPLSPSELEELLLSVVARLTGYPAAMLNMDMELEADLGVDSIKRVEILSVMRREVRDVGAGDIGRLGKLRTLREIVDALTNGAPSPGTTAPEVVEPPGSTGSTEVAVTAATSAPPAPRTASDERTPLTRLVPRAVESPPSGLATAGLLDGPVVVTGGGTAGSAMAGVLARKLAEHGVDATAETEVPADARAVIHLGALTSDATPDGAREVHRSALRAARAVSAAGTAGGGGLFVTVQDTGGDFGLGGGEPGRAWLGGVAGLARTAAKEWPDASVRVIDCRRGGRGDEEVAAAIVRELLEGGTDPEVGLRADGTRTLLRLVPERVTPGGAPRISSDSVIVATGGARGDRGGAARPGQGLPSADRAARQDRAGRRARRAGLRDRRTGPHPAARGTLRPGRGGHVARPDRAAGPGDPGRARGAGDGGGAGGRGSPVRYVRVDARDGAALAAALCDVRETWGPVTGIVHGAGVLADSLIADKSDDQAERVMSTKVDGLRALLEATADDPLDTICLFSSVAAVFGNPGQGDYAMANEVLHQVASAEQSRRPGCLVRCVAWGPWQGGMVSPALAAHFDRSGVPLIPLDQGAAAFTAELAGAAGEARVVLAAGDDPAALSPAADPRRAQVLLRSDTLPQLADHAPAGVPVLPVAMVLNWFAAAATAWLPDAGQLVLRDLRVYKTYALPELRGAGHRITVAGGRAPGSFPELEAELLGEDGPAHFRAVLDTGDGSPDAAAWDVPDGLEPLARAESYDGKVLFHGPRFQALRSVHGVSELGAEATVADLRALDWPGEHYWPLDPAAVDGALQLALLWGEEVLGAATLPMAVAECRVYRRGPVDGTVRCVVRGRKAHDAGARCDAALIDADGSVRLELIGVELVRRPS